MADRHDDTEREAQPVSPEVGTLVVVADQRDRGTGRLLSLLPEHGPPQAARVFFYDEGALALVSYDQVQPAPPGPSTPPARSSSTADG